MANLEFDAHEVKQLRTRARREAHVQKAQQMLVAAGLASLCVVAVAGVFLGQML